MKYFFISTSCYLHVHLVNYFPPMRKQVLIIIGLVLAASLLIRTPEPSPAEVTAFNPTSGPVATEVTITGTNFTNVTEVAFNGILASSFTVVAGDEVRAAVPTGATTGPVSVTNSAGSSASTDDFVVLSSPPVLVGAGDIAKCYNTKDEKTARLLDTIPGTVFTLGDNAYSNGRDKEFNNCYDPTWGRHKARTRPSPGNHDYHTPGASGYFNYFGAAAGEAGKGYYSYDLSGWHIIVLNSECGEVGGCDHDSPQGQWLQADLAANPGICQLAYWHKPRFSSGLHGNYPAMQAFWELLYDAGVDVILNGHDHNYERFAPQDPNGVVDPEHGIRQFVVGTGGKSLRKFKRIQPNSEVTNNNTYGVLKLTLHSTSYDWTFIPIASHDWAFIPIAGRTFTDSGSASCH